MNEVKDNFFGGSGSSFLKFFVREEKLTEDDIVELIKMINQTED
jgi:predicted transcriptional regulator